MALPRITLGTLCRNKDDGRLLRVIGHYQDSHKKHKLMLSASGTDLSLVKAIELPSDNYSIQSSEIIEVELAKL